VRLAKHSRLSASELDGIRAFGSESELQQVQTEVARRLLRLRRDYELTMERFRLSVVQGQVIDADDAVLYDWPTEFGQSIPAEINFDLANATPAEGAIRKKCNAVVRGILQDLQGLGGDQVRIVALAGDNFYDDLTAAKEVRETYLNTMEAADLRGSNAYEQFSYGGITWVNYRGNSGGKVAIPTDKAKIFPVGAGIFQIAQAPAETFQFVNTPGQELYAMVVPDRDRNMYVDIELYSYPLPVCVQPKALRAAKRT
jgi:hypothetical protein